MELTKEDHAAISAALHVLTQTGRNASRRL